MDVKYFLCVLGMVLFIEGLPYFIFPNRIKGWLRQVEEIPDGSLRLMGFIAMAAGLAVVYLGRS